MVFKSYSSGNDLLQLISDGKIEGTVIALLHSLRSLISINFYFLHCEPQKPTQCMRLLLPLPASYACCVIRASVAECNLYVLKQKLWLHPSMASKEHDLEFCSEIKRCARKKARSPPENLATAIGLIEMIV